MMLIVQLNLLVFNRFTRVGFVVTTLRVVMKFFAQFLSHAFDGGILRVLRNGFRDGRRNGRRNGWVDGMGLALS